MAIERTIFIRKELMTKRRTSPFTFSDKKFRTPAGTARWAYLTKPDDKFGKLKFKINIIFDPSDPEYKEFYKKVSEFAKEYYKSMGIKFTPNQFKFFKSFRNSQDESDPDTGKPYIRLETSPKTDENGHYIPVPIYNAKKEMIKASVWGGDVVKASFSLAGWHSELGTGIKGFLNAVQLLAAQPRESRDGSSVFQEESEYDNVADAVDSFADIDEDAFDDGDEELI